MEKELLLQLVNKKLSIAKIAKEVDKSESSVKYWLKKYNLKTITTYHTSKKNVVIDSHRVCSSCNVNRHINDYYDNTRNRKHNYCKTCSKNKIKNIQNNTKKEAVKYKGNSCLNCGYNKCIAALEFHHLDPKEKDINWDNFKKRKFDDDFKKELDKCILLCSNCHREVHYKN